VISADFASPGRGKERGVFLRAEDVFERDGLRVAEK